MSELYHYPTAMEPLFPSENSSDLRELAFRLIRDSAALSSKLHPVTRVTVARLVRSMNSYYSNLIEGHATHPVDIEKALRKDFSKETSKRLLQLESVAHIHVQEKMERRLIEEANLNICSFEFLSWIHYEFYHQLPDEYLIVRGIGNETHTIIPGEKRGVEVEVGRHLPPMASSLNEFLNRFRDAYGKPKQDQVLQIMALAASHHRLAWIHPFLDGNGRVIRLFTQAFLNRCELGGSGLWTLSRGLARTKDAYMAELASADQPRMGDLDGRGNLSQKRLDQFCKYILETALDQISFMSGLLELDTLQSRIKSYVTLESTRNKLAKESANVLIEVMLKGTIARGEAARITCLGERTARDVIADLLKRGLLSSESPKGVLTFACPPSVVPYYFPRLYPEAIEMGMEGKSNP